MRVLFVGVGSIAKRHIINLKTVCREKGISVRIDCVRRVTSLPLPQSIVQWIENIYTDEDVLPTKYDIVFITNPTNMHLEALLHYKDYTDSFFIEKPIFDLVTLRKWYASALFDTFSQKRVYVACPLRYNQVIQYIKKYVNVRDIYAIRSICSSYLPEWRPGTDYRLSYSADTKMGGGVKIDLIHEWDYLQYLFGYPIKIHCLSGKKSDLEIISEDLAVYVAEYPNMMIELHLDYFGRVARRELEIFTKEDTLIADINHGTIRYLKSGEQINFSLDRDDAQKAELSYALDIFMNKRESDNDIFRAIRTLELTEGILNENTVYDMRKGWFKGN
ncbi:MAG: Gfo/Idh/MocA family oxidoreductase [Lachnospiraceae bacterium]|nr:Gfo/Idh/MocA family oxidoreductase [Lachnospiraceae bacterium]